VAPRSRLGEIMYAISDVLNARILDVMFIVLPTSGGCTKQHDSTRL
jgi:hypothetical protein